jgi:5-methylcytosine-specific restriction endonuclease McrA
VSEILRPACGRGAWFATCPLIQWQGDKVPQTCHYCGGPLKGRQQKWCSEACTWAVLDNHHWGYARPAALKRDNHTCRDCGVHRDQLPRQLRQPAYWERLTSTERYAFESHRIPRSMRPDGPPRIHVWEVKLIRSLEVDHIVPILGKHATPGCHHHLDGLRTLCSDCHAKRTAAFAAERARARRSLKGEQLGLEASA